MEKRKNGKTANKRSGVKKALKRAGQAAAGAALAVSLFFGGLFSSPKQIVSPETASPKQAVVQTAELPPEPEFFAKEDAEPERKRSFKERVAERIQKLPAVIRILFVLPAWAVGFGIMWVVSTIGTLMNVPILGAVIKWIVGAAVVLGLILLAERLLFPDVPVKKLVSKQNLTALGICAAVIAAAGALGGHFWKDKQYITALIDVGAVAVYTVFLLIFTRGKSNNTVREAGV